MKCETFITKVCDKQCLDHKFLFKPMNDQCWNKQELDISYCPQHNKLKIDKKTLKTKTLYLV